MRNGKLCCLFVFCLLITLFSVKAKLFALGYEEEDWTFHVFSGQFADNKLWNKLVRQKRELTARSVYQNNSKIILFNHDYDL